MNLQLSSDPPLFLGAFLLAALATAGMYRLEFKRSPDKAARYCALPLRYKALCWLLVLPLFAGSLPTKWLLVPALASLYLAESCAFAGTAGRGFGTRALAQCCHRPSPPGCARS